jgi:hypothetical protein
MGESLSVGCKPSDGAEVALVSTQDHNPGDYLRIGQMTSPNLLAGSIKIIAFSAR